MTEIIDFLPGDRRTMSMRLASELKTQTPPLPRAANVILKSELVIIPTQGTAQPIRIGIVTLTRHLTWHYR
ncbi:hypothetical protein M1P56_04245 [Streptomyces sp. HU2014]|nr:hypothetical protein [Streptomyces sp. HU2014]UQI49626.1 hypothetical protein M1P56_04245 [Streptomyces sp. HU2014]